MTNQLTRREALSRFGIGAVGSGIIAASPGLILPKARGLITIPSLPPTVIPNLVSACGNHYNACAQSGNSTQAILNSGVSAVSALNSYMSSSGFWSMVQTYLPLCPTSAVYTPSQMQANAATQGIYMPAGYFSWGLPWAVAPNSVVNTAASLGHAPGFVSTMQSSYGSNWAAWFNSNNGGSNRGDFYCYNCHTPPPKEPYFPLDLSGAIANASVICAGIGTALFAGGIALTAAAAGAIAFPAALCFALGAAMWVLAMWLSGQAIQQAVVTSGITYPPDDPIG